MISRTKASNALRINREEGTVVLAINLCQSITTSPSVAGAAAGRGLTHHLGVGTSIFRGRGRVWGFFLFNIYTAEVKKTENRMSVQII